MTSIEFPLGVNYVNFHWVYHTPNDLPFSRVTSFRPYLTDRVACKEKRLRHKKLTVWLLKTMPLLNDHQDSKFDYQFLKYGMTLSVGKFIHFRIVSLLFLCVCKQKLLMLDCKEGGWITSDT